MPPNQKQEKGELRQDIITGKWVVVATGRSKRPTDYVEDKNKPKTLSKFEQDCPFCNLKKFPQAPDLLRLPDDLDDWEVHIFDNKYPAFRPADEYRVWQEGPYRTMEAVGYHEILATKQHHTVDAMLTYSEMSLQLEALVIRYRQLKEKPSVSYIQIIKNHGDGSGASLDHPHNQIFTTPVLPSDVQDLVGGAEQYAKKNNREVFQTILDFESEESKRIIHENEDFVAFCPYASRVSFEVWVMPKKPNPYFENLGPGERDSLAEIMVKVFNNLYIGLHDPPYNYYILSAPCDDINLTGQRHNYDNFRWHIQILPRLNTWGGFEMGTGLEIIDTLPEEAADYLRQQKINIIS